MSSRIAKYFQNILRNDYCLELFFIFVLFLVNSLFFRYFYDFYFINPATGQLRWFVLVASFAPVLFIYLILRLFMPIFVAFALVMSFSIVLHFVDMVKRFNTNTPLMWDNLVDTNNFSIFNQYVTWVDIVILVALGSVFLFWFFWKRPGKSGKPKSGKPEATRKKRRGTSRFVLSAAALCVFPLALYPHVLSENSVVGTYLLRKMQSLGVHYLAYDPILNVRTHSLFMHLVQTSQHRSLPDATPEEIATFKALAGRDVLARGNVRRPEHIVIILCESCWGDDQHFSSAFEPLRQMGFVETRGLAPDYGGNTPNATFEMLTGLPARGVLSGVIFQAYGPSFRDGVAAIPNVLRTDGYRTIGVHANTRHFWQRDRIFPKLGFDRFIGLEDMDAKKDTDHSGHDLWVRDSVMYDKALDYVARYRDQKLFLYLLTNYTHGPYRSVGNDAGEGDYTRRLSQSVTDLAEFVKKAVQYQPDTLFLLFGDHKPALSVLFQRKGVFLNQDFYHVDGDIMADDSIPIFLTFDTPMSRRGDVPLFLFYPKGDSALLQQTAHAMNDRPFFCAAKALNDTYLHTDLPSFAFSGQQRLCENDSGVTYRALVAKYPSWLYKLSLFE